MNESKLKKRIDADPRYTWDVTSMYENEDDWQKDIDNAIRWAKDFTTHKGELFITAMMFSAIIEEYMDILRTFEHAFVYARMKRDEDNSVSRYIEMCNTAASAGAQISAYTSFFVPEILTSDLKTIDRYIKSEPSLKKYTHFLHSIMDRKEHVLSEESEKLLATISEITGASGDIFSMLNDADMSFGTITDENGTEISLTHGNFVSLMESPDREVRKTAFEQLYAKYAELNNTMGVMYNYNVKEDVVTANLRNYESSLDMALSGEHIPTSVYTNLIDAVHEYLPAMYKYVSIRKEILGVEELHMYDVYRPLVKPSNLECSYEEAVEICCKALAPLGEEYVSVFREGVTTDGWVDVFENENKTSGAYSFGSYDSKPFIMMNFSEELRDVFTLIHESGHSMHSYYTRKTQPYVYGSHSIFTAEVASTVNETLLIRYLLDNVSDFVDISPDDSPAEIETKTKEMETYLVNLYIDEFKSTVIRQTMFAEFELKAHDIVEAGGSLTGSTLNSMYDELNTKYFGPDMSHDDYIQYEWSRIPHFYRSYYVYQYATGYSAANAIANRILNGGDTERDDYLRFLTTGDSDYPIELLKIAGVDMSTKEPVESALKTFSELVDRLEELVIK